MLEKVRKPTRGKTAKGVVAYVVFGTICLVFVFFGFFPMDIGGVSGGTGAAVVNSQVISVADFQSHYDRLREQYEKQLAGLPASERKKYYGQLAERAIGELINRELLSQAAKSQGFVVVDDELRETIVNIAAFQEDGRFQRELYDRYITYTRQTPGMFEKRLRKDMAAQTVAKLFVQGVATSQAEDQLEQQARDTKFNLEYLRFDRAQLEKAVEKAISSEEVGAYIQDSKNLEALQAKYDKDKEQYKNPEQTRARHILIKAKQGNKDEEDKALAQIQKIEEKLKQNPENFAKLAEEFSEDMATKTKQGDLGFFNRGRMVPEFDEVAFNLPVGQTSGPVQTQFGFHLIKIEERKGGDYKSFDDVKQEIARKEMASGRVDSEVSQVEEWLKNGDMAKISAWASGHNFKWEETGEFALDRDSIPKLRQWKSLEPLMTTPEVGKHLPELANIDGRYHVVKIKSVVMPEVKPTDDKSKVSFFGSPRANEALEDWQEGLKEQAKIRRNNSIF
ncbi:MAG: SurA N-terminal domain-containing protein [Pseudobdellovibrionaceae bacterium]|nr:SurA N-terminal domain-containing protein [Bdellovibrionales bacterium]USN48752.1 MAG: SurA N-terminal domain-containing protein [Pseudobdellovibrionaceae bacterium]